jgi:hypothetical protein
MRRSPLLVTGRGAVRTTLSCVGECARAARGHVSLRRDTPEGLHPQAGPAGYAP